MESEQFPLRKVEMCNWLLLGILCLIASSAFSSQCIQGILLGGVIANLSFFALKRDLTGILNGPLAAAKFRFFIKYYARLILLAVVLFFLVRHWHIHIFGLLTGLSTVVISIVAVAIGEAKKIFLSAKEAA